jgi:tetratricopeptide (TPR) repeat protein
LYGLKASIFTQLQRWREAVNAADEGLALDPEHSTCLNVRAQALVMLGDKAGAALTVQDALRKNPDDPWIHANQGWASLHANEPTKAAEHFREALRLDPTMEFARAGIIEALKARNFLYRLMLRYFLAMARLPSQARWGVIIGVFVVQRLLSSLGNNNPALAPYTIPILAVIVGFAILTWLSYPLFNLMLRVDSFGRHALSAEERKGANLLGGTLLVALAFLAAYFIWGSDSLLWGALVFGILSLPISTIYVISEGWPRNTMIACTALLLLIGLPPLVPSQLIIALQSEAFLLLMAILLKGTQILFPIGVIGSQFLANGLMGVKVKK